MTYIFRTAVTLVAASAIVSATPIFSTSPGATLNSLPVSAQASFTLAPDQLTITLTNLEVNPTSVIENLSGIEFMLSDGLSSGSLASSVGTDVTIASQGTVTLGSSISTGWVLNALNGGMLQLTMLGTALAPAHTIIGPADGNGVYSAGNNSITGNGPHNPFLDQAATFVLSIPGVKADTKVSNVTFSFNTDVGYNAPGTPAVPEPATEALIGSGLFFVALIRRRRA